MKKMGTALIVFLMSFQPIFALESNGGVGGSVPSPAVSNQDTNQPSVNNPSETNQNVNSSAPVANATSSEVQKLEVELKSGEKVVGVKQSWKDQVLTVQTESGLRTINQSDISKAFILDKDGNHLMPVELNAAVEHQRKARNFWNTKSKSKLAWGWVLLLAGGAGAAYGLSSKTTTSQEDRLVNVSPSDVTLQNITSGATINWGAHTMTESVDGQVRNNGTEHLYNVVVNVEYVSDNLGTTLASENSTVSDLPSSTVGLWGTDTSFSFPGTTSFTRTISVASAQAMRLTDVSKSEKKAPALGYIGAGSAVLGLSFLISYAASSALPVKAAENIEVNPNIYANGNGIFQGVTLAYKF